MTDQQNYTDETAQAGLVVAASSDAAFVRTYPLADSGKGVPVMVPTLALLAMIDRAAPEMMRAYLRERSDLMDSPHGPAAEHFDYLDAIPPEADSPEDVDEQQDTVQQMRESGRQLGEAWRALSDAFREASKR